MKFFRILFFLFLASIAGYSQNIDSLVILLPKLSDTAKVELLASLTWNLRSVNTQKALEYGNAGLHLADSINYINGRLKMISFIGIVHRNLGNYSEALKYYSKHLELSILHKNYEQKGYAYSNIGNLYYLQDQFKEAGNYLQMAEKIGIERNDKNMLPFIYNNFGKLYTETRNFQKALEYLEKSYRIYTEKKRPEGQAVALKLMGDVYLNSFDYKNANKCYTKALIMKSFDNDMDLLADIMDKKAEVLLSQNKMDEAKYFAQQSLNYAIQINSKLRIRDAYKKLSKIATKLNDFESSTQYLNLAYNYNDSLYSEELSRKIAGIQYTIENQQKQKEIESLNTEKEIKETSLSRQKTFIIALILGLAVTVVLIISLRNSNIKRKRANDLLEVQKNEIELNNTMLSQKNIEIEAQRDEISHQKNQITDSIAYAEKIQSALLTPYEFLKEYITDVFLIFRPKDVVSGDFYWMKIEQNLLYIVVADCTGHGVPGAFMSLLGISFINQVAKNKEVATSAQFIIEINKMLSNSLKLSDIYDQDDGMSISLCILNLDNFEMQFAGNDHSIYIVRENHNIPLLVKADSALQKIVNYSNEKATLYEIHGNDTLLSLQYHYYQELTNYTIQVSKDDLIYLFTDGYKDQFGGQHHKKFLSKNFINEILANFEYPLPLQKEKLEQTFVSWKGKNKQVDDILIVGLQI